VRLDCDVSQAGHHPNWPLPSRRAAFQSVDPIDLAPYWFGADHLGLGLSAGPRGPIDGAVPRVNVAPSSHMLCSRVRSSSVTLLSRLRARPPSRSTFAPTASREALHTEHTSLACGSLRRIPMPAYAAAPCHLAMARRPTGLASPGSTRRVHLPTMSQAGSSMGTSAFRGFSPFAPSWPHAARRSEPPATRTVLPAVSRLATKACREADTRDATPRLRGFMLDCPTTRHRATWLSERMRSPASALFTPPTGRSSLGCYPPSRMTFRPRPTLLQDSSLGLQSSMRARPSPRGSGPAHTYVRSSEYQRTGSTGLHEADRPPWGSCLGAPAPRRARVLGSP
jgi:hypothetical protein